MHVTLGRRNILETFIRLGDRVAVDSCDSTELPPEEGFPNSIVLDTFIIKQLPLPFQLPKRSLRHRNFSHVLAVGPKSVCMSALLQVVDQVLSHGRSE